jgi:hypothetical protein
VVIQSVVLPGIRPDKVGPNQTVRANRVAIIGVNLTLAVTALGGRGHSHVLSSVGASRRVGPSWWLKIDRASTHHQGELNMSRYGYARDRGEFSRARQVEALVASGIPEELIFRDVGGLTEAHPGLDALLAVLTWEDEIVTPSADRLVRGPAHTGPLIGALATSGATARTLDGVEIAGKIDVHRAQLAAADAIRERERQLARPVAPDA